MERLLTTLRAVLARLTARDCPPDLIDAMDTHMRADLPAYHPQHDDGCWRG